MGRTMSLIDISRQRGPRQLIDRFTSDDNSQETRAYWLVFFAILLAGAVLRFWNLGAGPIWMDEAVSLGFARLPASTILFGQIDNHPPLSFLIQHLWQAVVPDPAYARVPAALSGVFGLAAIMFAARDQVSPRCALFAGLVFAFSTAHIYYSQDARMYPHLVLGLILASWGGLGQLRENLYGPRTYAALYVIGGAIAIYSHLIGLVVMALIGFASLAGGLMRPDARRFATDWLVRNLVLFVVTLPWLIQIPAASGTFPGLSDSVGLLDMHWFYRNATGFPGLGGPSFLVEAVLYAAAGLSVPIAWLRGRRGLAVMLAALIVLFPLVILALHLRQPIISNRVLLPGLIGVTLGAAYTLASLRPKLAGVAAAGLIALAGLRSSGFELAHRVKLENYPAAFAFADARGYEGAPVLTCIHFTTAAVWEARREAQVLYYRRGDIIEYHGPEYWQAASNSMAWLRAADAAQIDEALGGGWRIDGGLAGALQGQERLVFMRPFCPGNKETEILAALSTLGFAQETEKLVDDGAADFTILQAPEARVSLHRRTTEAD